MGAVTGRVVGKRERRKEKRRRASSYAVRK